jgi:acyl carrier protein
MGAGNPLTVLRYRPECLGTGPTGISILHRSQIFSQCHIVGPISWSDCDVFSRLGLIMTIKSLISNNQTTPISQARTLIANHLGVSIGCVTDEAHFTDDLGADWLDRLELMIVIEDQFAGMEITDADIDQIEVVGDLIRYIETAGTGGVD